ncbi:5'-3' exoribonuclease 2 [Amphichorda felina]
MGIPAAFRWLSSRYPKIISPVIEDQPVTMPDGTIIPVDTTRPNPNGEEFDNLYLDMNGIVHPCSHPEDKPAPKDEEEMMLEVFKYTDRVVNMVRPRKILMIAVDGVAPRAKMNQQRSRRFRSAQEAQEKEVEKQEFLQLLKQQNGGSLPAENEETLAKKAFDSNSITPGTPFMDILATSLRYWCQYKLNTDPGWAKLKVIISDATVPGEGEHKIMSFVRSQRASPDHDPNTRHVIYGLDADLIMLGLATHEPHFRVLREDVFFQDSKTRTCKLCGQKGHEARNCKGEAKEKEGDFDEKDNAVALKPFIWLHVSILREYLAIELSVPGLPFRFDLERAVDDWIFMCCFVGNDFLPHLPALEIREDGIDTLTAIWRDNLPSMGGYVTKDGHIDMARAQCILDGLAKQEDAIFKRRKEQEDRREANAKRRKLQNDSTARNGAPGGKRNTHQDHTAGQKLFPIGSFPQKPPQAITHDMVVNRNAIQDANVANKSAASVLKNQLRGGKIASDASTEAGPETPPSTLGKRKASDLGGAETADTPGSSTPTAAADEKPADDVRLWEDGYQDRYYQQKFHRDPRDIDFRRQVAHAYAEGLAWVLLYYFQGCPSWEWYYPYHYAPFAADFKDLDKMEISFEKGRISRPFEQLMSVLPAASRHALPNVFHTLMTDKDSEIIDFYPEDFEVDLNGKKFAWQGVALLPFIEMPRLLSAVQAKYPLLSEADAARNGVGKDVLLLSDAHEGIYDEILTNFYSKKQGAPHFKLNPKTSAGLSGKVAKQDEYVPHGMLQYPLERKTMPDLEYDRSVR